MAQWLTIERKDKAAEILKHPVGNRRTDEQLIMAALIGHVGRRGQSHPPVMADATGKKGKPLTYPIVIPDLSHGFDHAIKVRGTGEPEQPRLERLLTWLKLRRASPAPAPKPTDHRLWYLQRTLQQDQDGTPQCVAYTKKHWELTLPVGNRHGLAAAADYARAKEIDGDTEEGTWATTMLRVAEEQGLVESAWWWNGPEDTPAIDEWLKYIGTLWLGSYWTEEMFRAAIVGTKATPRAILEVGSNFQYGHEVLLIGTDRKRKTRTICNSWGLDNFGIEGRAEIPDEGFDRLMAASADLVGVVERRAKAA